MALCKLLTLFSIIAMASAAGFVSQGVVPANDMLTLCVALMSNNIASLEEKLMSLSTPGSPEFRQWLSIEEVKSFVQPSLETVSAFSSFASANSLKPTVISLNGDWVSIMLPVSQANQLFDTQFEVFMHPDMSDTIMCTLSVSLPSCCNETRRESMTKHRCDGQEPHVKDKQYKHKVLKGNKDLRHKVMAQRASHNNQGGKLVPNDQEVEIGNQVLPTVL
ncbi:hypothetical protein BT96DRAFT_1040618 [Gymnopus androsaceus JB14]|uniref:Peptidase S53 activation domain-containing protein n=1 Tax=Gymnopus androsaceus JB14 TaxID=1447944 RepID=A0A6A4HD38_9AGAR|nr:hypothetical protein BT96DRAFT_1040618 [Gymnopus androsaceus JB14]